MAYCTVTDVRNETGLSTDEISNDDVTNLISSATVDLNAMINVRRWDEHVRGIDNEKENDIDGSNTTFYTRYFPIGDLNNDGAISTDDIEVYSLDSDGTRATLTVDSINDDEIGKFTLSSAPSDVDVYLCYYQAPLDEETPHALIKKACVELAAAKAYQMTSDGAIKSFKLGSFSVVRERSSYLHYMERYSNTVRQIIAKDMHEAVGKNIWD